MCSDLRGLFLSPQDVAILWLMLKQAAMAKRDSDLLQLCTSARRTPSRRPTGCRRRIKEAAPQALTV
jgi:hypothetical protein